MIPKVASWKKGRVSELSEIFAREGSFAIVDVSGVPASNMIAMRNSLRGRMTLTMAKKSLMRLAWIEAGKEAEELETLLMGADQPCVVHSKEMNAFEIFNELEKTRQGRPAKEGDKAPADIVVEEGPTQFGPGPIVGEFNAVGIPAKIDKGKVVIQKTTTVVNQGEDISADLGIMLSKLEINPIEIGLILTGVIENGFLFRSSELNLDLDGFRDELVTAASRTYNLACNISWFSPVTTPALISKASNEALSVAIEARVVNDKTASIILSKAFSQALSLTGKLDSSALDEELIAVLGAASQTAEVVSSETTAPDEEAAGESSEEEEEEEEEAEFGGLGDLFG